MPRLEQYSVLQLQKTLFSDSSDFGSHEVESKSQMVYVLGTWDRRDGDGYHKMVPLEIWAAEVYKGTIFFYNGRWGRRAIVDESSVQKEILTSIESTNKLQFVQSFEIRANAFV